MFSGVGIEYRRADCHFSYLSFINAMPSKMSKRSRSSKKYHGKSSKKVSRSRGSHSDYGKLFKNEKGLCLYSSMNQSNPIPRYMDVSVRATNTSTWLTPVGTGNILLRIPAVCFTPFRNLTGANGVTAFTGSGSLTNCRGFLSLMATAATPEDSSGGIYLQYLPLSSKITIRPISLTNTAMQICVCPTKNGDATNSDVNAVANSPNGVQRLCSVYQDSEDASLVCVTDLAKQYGIPRSVVVGDTDIYAAGIAGTPTFYTDYQVGVSGPNAAVVVLFWRLH